MVEARKRRVVADGSLPLFEIGCREALSVVTSPARHEVRLARYVTQLAMAMHECGLATRRDIGERWNWPPTRNQLSKLERLAPQLVRVKMDLEHTVALRGAYEVHKTFNRQVMSDLLLVMQRLVWHKCWPR